MTPSMTESDFERFIQESGWNPYQKPGERDMSHLEEHVLIFADNALLYLVDTDKSIIQFGARFSPIKSFCAHKGRLYDGCENEKIHDTIKGVIIADSKQYFKSLCSHAGRLYDCGFPSGILDVESNSIVAGEGRVISSLCSHEGRLYDVWRDGKVRDSFSDEIMAECDMTAKHMCSFDGKLYHVEERGDVDYAIFETIDRKVIASRDAPIVSLFVHNGRLCDATIEGNVHDTFNDFLYLSHDIRINSMCSHPRSYFIKEDVLQQ